MKKTSKDKKGGDFERAKDQFTVVLEDINSKFDLVLEGQQETTKRVDRLEIKVEEGFKKVDGKVDKLEGEMKAGFKLTFDHLNQIEQELHGEVKSKVSLKEFGALEKRVEKLERMRSH